MQDVFSKAKQITQISALPDFVSAHNYTWMGYIMCSKLRGLWPIWNFFLRETEEYYELQSG